MKTPTFTISPDRQPSRHPGHRLQLGFTLIELLVVLAIAGLLVAFIPAAYNKSKESAQYSSMLRSMMGDMRQARQNAMTQGRPAVFFVDLVKRTYGLSETSARALPEAVTVKATVAGQQLQQGSVASIVFLPDGGATGGSFDVTRPSGVGTRLRIDWLSGQITQEKLRP